MQSRHGEATMTAEQDDALRVAGLTIDSKTRRVDLAGREILLTPIEFGLLAVLAEHPTWVCSPPQIEERIWGFQSDDSHIVAVHMSHLRRKLSEAGVRCDLIETVRGFGYRLRVNGNHAIGQASSASQPFVGRVSEVTRLVELLMRACDGFGGAVMLTGEAGIGKTRCAEQATAQPRVSAYRWFGGAVSPTTARTLTGCGPGWSGDA